jgi:hypothetical protein
MKEDLNRVKEKIRALKALAADSGATEGEVTAAMNLAQKLCHEYMLNLADIEDDRVVQVELQVDKIIRDLRDFKIKAAMTMDYAIVRLFDCEMIYNDYKMTETIMGTETDRQTVDYCIDFAHNTMHAAWERYKRSYEYSLMRERFKAKQLKKDFMTGFGHGVAEKCYEMKKNQEDVKLKSTGTSLIIVKSTAVEEFKKKEFPNLKSVKTRAITINSSRTLDSGKEIGRKIEFTKPISGANSPCHPSLSCH